MSFDWSQHQPFNKPARQIYLGQGFGRLTQQELVDIEKRCISMEEPLPKNTKLKILVSQLFLLKEHTVKSLIEKNLDVEVTEYSNYQEYSEKIHQEKFDLIQTNNDFSQQDLIENLRVTFNQSRPLIFLPKNDIIFEKLASANTLSSNDEKKKIMEFIAKRILEQAFAVPIVHYNTYDYYLPEVDVTHVSKAQAEFLFWKMRIH